MTALPVWQCACGAVNVEAHNRECLACRLREANAARDELREVLDAVNRTLANTARERDAAREEARWRREDGIANARLAYDNAVRANRAESDANATRTELELSRGWNRLWRAAAKRYRADAQAATAQAERAQCYSEDMHGAAEHAERERDALRAAAKAYLAAVDDAAFAKEVGSERGAKLDIARRRIQTERALRALVEGGEHE